MLNQTYLAISIVTIDHKSDDLTPTDTSTNNILQIRYNVDDAHTYPRYKGAGADNRVSGLSTEVLPNASLTDSGTDITFTFRGTKDDNTETLLWITRKDFSHNPIQNLGKCIIISPREMIRTVIYHSSSCDNPENKRYDHS